MCHTYKNLLGVSASRGSNGKIRAIKIQTCWSRKKKKKIQKIQNNNNGSLEGK